MDSNLAEKIIKESAKEAGKLLMDNFNTSISAFLKAKSNIVTDIWKSALSNVGAFKKQTCCEIRLASKMQ